MKLAVVKKKDTKNTKIEPKLTVMSNNWSYECITSLKW